MTYSNLSENLMPDEREEMYAVWDDDEKFDAWLKELDQRRKLQAAQQASQKPGAKGKKIPISNDEYLRKYAKHYGGDEGASK